MGRQRSPFFYSCVPLVASALWASGRWTIGFKEVDGLGYFIIVVAVDLDDIPIEGTEFVG